MTAARTAASTTGRATSRGGAATAAPAAGSAGLVWKEGTRRAIAYVEGRENAEQVLVITGRAQRVLPTQAPPPKRKVGRGSGGAQAEREGGLNGAAMAVYTDRRGRPFAWQIPFEIGHFERVAALIRGENGG